MEQNKFNELVDTLLKPQVKDYIKKSRQLQHKEHATALDSSIRLAPHVEAPCSDCGVTVVNRRVEFYKLGIGTSREHWKKHCVNCKSKTKISRGDIVK